MSSRRFRYAYNLVTYGAEPVAQGIARLDAFGYDAIEVAGDPAQTAAIKLGLADTDLAVSSISCLFTADHDLAAAAASTRSTARDYLLRMVEMAAELGAPVLNVAPAAVNRTEYESDPAQERAWAVAGLRQVADAAEGVCRLAIEPWNRYETHLVNTLAQAVALADEVDHPAVGVMADLFHMNIEEFDPVEALRACFPKLCHIQFADSTRAAPGTGGIDFRAYLALLHDLDYTGTIAFELFPAKARPLDAVAAGSAPEFFDEYTERSLQHLLSCERGLGLS